MECQVFEANWKSHVVYTVIKAEAECQLSKADWQIRVVHASWTEKLKQRLNIFTLASVAVHCNL